MASERGRWGSTTPHRTGLRLSGRENQSIRLVIRMSRRRFAAINDSGLPALTGLCTVAQKYPGIRSPLLALASSLLPLPSSVTTLNTNRGSNERETQSDILEHYQAALENLQRKISELEDAAATHDYTVELLGSVLVLVLAGFPGSIVPSHDADWTLHVSGIMSLIESLDKKAIESALISRLGRAMAAQMDIRAFSRGSSLQPEEKVNAWLRWSIEPPDTPPHSDFLPLKVFIGYPRSLITLIAAVSAVLDSRDDEGVDELVCDTVQSLHMRACQGRSRGISPHSQNEFTGLPTSERLLSQLETALTLWQQPCIPDRVSTAACLALTTSWEIMRKAALIFLWRRGFGASVRQSLPPDRSTIAIKFIREMLLGFSALFNLYDERRITITNVLTWPLVLVANECSNARELREEVLHLLRGMYERFGIQHIKQLIIIIESLWQRVDDIEHGEDVMESSMAGSKDSMEVITLELGLCLPIF
ncbi:hypothetical protein FOBRF1_012097 [Fusarium oxysporum]